MARKSDGEKIDELKELSAGLKVSLETLAKELQAVYDAHSKTANGLADLRREFEKKIILLDKGMEDLTKWKDDQKKDQDEQSRRLWAFGPTLIGAPIGGLITATVAYFTRQ